MKDGALCSRCRRAPRLSRSHYCQNCLKAIQQDSTRRSGDGYISKLADFYRPTRRNS